MGILLKYSRVRTAIFPNTKDPALGRGLKSLFI